MSAFSRPRNQIDRRRLPARISTGKALRSNSTVKRRAIYSRRPGCGVGARPLVRLLHLHLLEVVLFSRHVVPDRRRSRLFPTRRLWRIVARYPDAVDLDAALDRSYAERYIRTFACWSSSSLAHLPLDSLLSLFLFCHSRILA